MRDSAARAGRSMSGRTSAWNAAVARAGSLPSGQPRRCAQSAANASNARWKPTACSTFCSTVLWAGSSAPSSTIARTRCGKASA